ncbi:MAG: adenosine deaminase [Rickettsiales bacterium]|nr:adenosine deaminase [Rickettsiales bacterium]
MANKNLHNAKEAKNDEFYTQLTDIEKEVYHYKEQLKDKVIYCNCDDPAWSNFVRYFLQQFNFFQLKGLIATGYIKGANSLTKDINLFNDEIKVSYKLEFKKVNQNLIDKIADSILKKISNDELFMFLKQNGFIKELQGDGDFRSDECIKLLQQADVVITNPPFSLFREYVGQLMDYNKKFLIIGNKNAITYKEVFKYIKENKLWLGYNSPCEFAMPNGVITKQQNGLTRWFTNCDVSKRLEKLVLYKKYYSCEEDKNNPNYTNPEYPKYDNYDAIEVSKVADIPIDYDGVMGVPITFLDKYNPRQFEIERFRKGNDDKDLQYTIKEGELREREDNNTSKQFNHISEYSFVLIGIDRYVEGNKTPNRRMCINGKELFARVLIRKI